MKIYSKFICISLSIFLLFGVLPSLCFAWSGKVVAVSDGDTIKVLHDGIEEKIRLYGIDTPEKRQSFGQKARDLTSALVAGKNVEVERKDTDRYGRIVGLVSIDGQSINESIIREGYAWVYRQYCKERFCSDWIQAEDAARREKKGMWSDPHIIPPWEWRHQGRKRLTSQRQTNTGAGQKGDIATGGYHGNASSHKFHSPRCRFYNCKNCTTVFKSKEDAIRAGFSPCKTCIP